MPKPGNGRTTNKVKPTFNGREKQEMADEVGGSSGSTDGGDVAGGASSLESNTSDGGVQNTPDDGSQGSAQDGAVDEGNTDDGFVTGPDGKKYIPQEAFDARIAKLTAQKNDARSLLESIKNDPNVRKEFLESLNIGEQSGNSSEDSDEPTPFEQFLAPLPQEHQAHYRNMAQAMATEFTGYVQTMLDQFKKENLTPLMTYVGQEKLKSFAATNKDFNKYERQIAKIMDEGRAKSVEDAYKLASFEDKMKSVFSAGQKEELERRNKLNRTPSAGQNSGGVNTRNSKPFSLREALNKAGMEHGYTG